MTPCDFYIDWSQSHIAIVLLMYFTAKSARDFSAISKPAALTKTYDANVIPLILQGVMEALLSSLAHCEMMAVAIS